LTGRSFSVTIRPTATRMDNPPDPSPAERPTPTPHLSVEELLHLGWELIDECRWLRLKEKEGVADPFKLEDKQSLYFRRVIEEVFAKVDFSREKLAVARAQLLDTRSELHAATKDLAGLPDPRRAMTPDERRQHDALRKAGRPVPPPQPRREAQNLLQERVALIEFVRNAATTGRVGREAAERILAETGETVDEIDSNTAWMLGHRVPGKDDHPLGRLINNPMGKRIFMSFTHPSAAINLCKAHCGRMVAAMQELWPDGIHGAQAAMAQARADMEAPYRIDDDHGGRRKKGRGR
jgi:hypothetical protein